jgi:lipopolysaccharide biosynthesis glycosyltransferase
MKRVLILGNGASRLKLKSFVDSWEHDLWVCNKGYMEYKELPRIDYVCSVHREVIEEAKMFLSENNLFYRTLSPSPLSDEQFVCTKGWSTGNLAIVEAIKRDYDEIHLAGFDFGGKDIYQSYETDGSNFKKQFEQIKVEFPEYEEKIEFHYPKNKKKVKFISMVDNSFVPGAEGFFKSLLDKDPNFSYGFILLNNGLNSENILKLKSMYSDIIFKSIRKELYDFPYNSTIDKLRATYYKLEIFDPSNFEDDLDRLVFIDMDILVNGSLDYLAKVDLKDKPIGACRQYNSIQDSLKDEINSGVLVIDLKNLPSETFYNVLERAKEGAHLPDQEIINREFVDNENCFYLDKRYNIEKRMVLSSNLKKIYDKFVCLHFVSTKPWDSESRKENVFKDAYKRWWSMFETEKKENKLDKVPLLFRKEKTLFLDFEEDVDGVYDCIFLESDFKPSRDFINKICQENLSEKGYFCGYGSPFRSGTNGGIITKALRKKCDYYKDNFWLFLKNSNRTYIISSAKKIEEGEFIDYLKNKSVILVGPSSCMLGRGLGEFIDSFDIVIRTNNMLNTLLDNNLEEDFGRTCDILYTNVTYERDMFDCWRQKKWSTFNLRYLCKCMTTDEIKRPLRYKWRPVPNEPKLPPPTTHLGLKLVYDVLQCDVKSFYITGMDGYQSISDYLDGKNKEYVKGYLPELELQRRKKRIGGLVSKHDRYRDTRYILELVEKDERAQIDPFCKEKMEIIANGKG